MQRRMVFLGVLAAVAAGPARAEEPIYKDQFNAFTGKNLEQKVQELADREEIRELIARYAHRVAHRVSPADLFTDDGGFIVRSPGSPPLEAHGREQVVKRFEGIMANPDPSLPQIHNQLIEITGDTARGICSIEVRAVRDGKSMIGSGYYEDTFRRVNGHWKFVIRDSTMFHLVPANEGWAKKAN